MSRRFASCWRSARGSSGGSRRIPGASRGGPASGRRRPCATRATRSASCAGATPAGFGGPHPTGLGALAGEGGALANAPEKEMGHQRRREEPRETGEILAGLRPAPERTALRELARRAELKENQLATRSVRKGPPP